MGKKRNQAEYERSGVKKLNNSGMTLIEILVSIIIFSLVSAVFLRSFIYAFQLNEQAKQKQYSMILAQSLMESVKAYNDIDNLDDQFSGTKSFMVYDLGTGGTIDNSPNPNPEMHDAFSIPENSSQMIYARTYKLKNIVYQEAQFGDRYKYDVDILVKPSQNSTYREQLVKAQGVNAYSDAIYIEGEDEQAALWDDVKAGLVSEGHAGTITTLNTNKISAKRTITIKITDNGVVTVEPVYEYSVNDYPITKLDGTTDDVSFSGTVTATDAPFTCYDKTVLDSAVALENLYFYYYPAYNKAANQLIKCSSDEIKIENGSSTLKNIYLIKQENPNLSQADIDASEGSYSPKVNLQSTATPTGSEWTLKLYHNLDRTLHSDTMVVPPPSITSVGNVENKGVPWKEETAYTVLLYDVTVTVKKSGESAPICEIQGSTNAKKLREDH
ncbi:MAG: type II secretion system GspH family protein [Bacteroidales bacterium]|nr:type II secretion system GspH family protein [Lachnoclostridium sp.]MCM1385061.1 type II secretion system GspH family protein [Lachnoclostridium sp.]MCM1465307.1 type II secretion system GspH family protein [Bacteroidales bacterium]